MCFVFRTCSLGGKAVVVPVFSGYVSCSFFCMLSYKNLKKQGWWARILKKNLTFALYLAHYIIKVNNIK